MTQRNRCGVLSMRTSPIKVEQQPKNQPGNESGVYAAHCDDQHPRRAMTVWLIPSITSSPSLLHLATKPITGRSCHNPDRRANRLWAAHRNRTNVPVYYFRKKNRRNTQQKKALGSNLCKWQIHTHVFLSCSLVNEHWAWAVVCNVIAHTSQSKKRGGCSLASTHAATADHHQVDLVVLGIVCDGSRHIRRTTLWKQVLCGLDMSSTWHLNSTSTAPTLNHMRSLGTPCLAATSTAR